MSSVRKRGLGRLLLAVGVPTMLVETFQSTPIPVLFLAGLVVAFCGGCLIADSRA